MAISLTCDGLKRRDFLRVGALGTGLSLAGYLRLASAGDVNRAKAKAKSAIFINLTTSTSFLGHFLTFTILYLVSF